MLASAAFFLRVFLCIDVLWVAAITAVLAILFFALGGGFAKKISCIVFAVLTVAFTVLPFLYGGLLSEKEDKALSFVSDKQCKVIASVTEVRFQSAYASSYLVDVREIDGSEVEIDILLELERGTYFEYGDIIEFEAVFEKTKEEEAYLRAENIFVRAASEDAVRTGREEKSLLYKLSELNKKAAARFVDFMGRDAGGFCAAIVLGNKSYIDAGVKLNFSRSGISHLLALSGLHLSVLAGALDFLLRGIAKKKTRGIIMIIACFAFAIFTGLSASVLRASVMLAFVFAADIFGEENDPLTALFAAVWIILLIDGSSAYDVGFQLSASATLGIILLRPACDALFAKWKRTRKNLFLGALRAIAKYFYGIFTMSAAATFFTLPIIGYTFGEFSLAGLWANFIFLPLATVLIIFSVLFIPFSFVPVLGTAWAFVCELLAEAIIALSATVSDIRGISLSLAYPFAPYLLSLLALMLIACIFIKRLSLLKIGAGVLAFALSFAVCFGIYSNMTASDMLVCIGSDKSGEYAAFSAGGENYIVDVSTGGYSFIYEALESRKLFCATEIDNFVLTHYHNYHASAIYRLCDKVKIRKIIIPKPETDTEKENFEYLAETLENIGIEYEIYERGGAFENGDVCINFASMRKMGRSEKPIVAFTVNYTEWSFSYVEGAAIESGFDYSEHLSAQTVFVGSHGPARKFYVSARALKNAANVIFAQGAEELLRDTEYLANKYNISEYGGKMTVLYDN